MNDPVSITVALLVVLGIASGIIRYSVRRNPILGLCVSLAASLGSLLIAETMLPELSPSAQIGYCLVWGAVYILSIIGAYLYSKSSKG